MTRAMRGRTPGCLATAVGALLTLPAAAAQDISATTGCDLGELFVHMHTIEDACCTGGNACESGYPGPEATCSHECATIFEPFWDGCGTTLMAMGTVSGMESLPAFYDTCLESLYPPGQCGDDCSHPGTFRCKLADVQSGCCSDASNCPEGQATPNACPVECALVFPTFLEDCRAPLSEQAGSLDEYERFSRGCMKADSVALVEYAIGLRERGCLIDLSGDGAAEQGHRRALQSAGMGVWATTAEGCYFDTIDEQLFAVSEACCADESSCLDGAPPSTCTPTCAVVFHSMFSSCQDTLLRLVGEAAHSFSDFDSLCTSHASVDTMFYLRAISDAECSFCSEFCAKQRGPDGSFGCVHETLADDAEPELAASWAGPDHCERERSVPITNVECSSQYSSPAWACPNAIDCVGLSESALMEGYQGSDEGATNRWVTQGEGVGASIELTFASESWVTGMSWSHRENDEMFSDVTLLFSDGSSQDVHLEHSHEQIVYPLTPVLTSSVRVTALRVYGGSNIGASEVWFVSDPDSFGCTRTCWHTGVARQEEVWDHGRPP